MKRNSMKLASAIVVAGVAATYFVHRSSRPKTSAAQPAEQSGAKPEGTPPAYVTQSQSWLKDADAIGTAHTLGGAEQPADAPRVNQVAHDNRPEDPEVYTDAEAPPEVSGTAPANVGAGSRGAEEDPRVYPGAEAPAVPNLRAHLVGAGATGAQPASPHKASPHKG